MFSARMRHTIPTIVGEGIATEFATGPRRSGFWHFLARSTVLENDRGINKIYFTPFRPFSTDMQTGQRSNNHCVVLSFSLFWPPPQSICLSAIQANRVSGCLMPRCPCKQSVYLIYRTAFPM